MFVSERGAPFSKRRLQAMLERAGEAAGFEMKIHPDMKSIQHTVRYTELSPTRFKNFWPD